MLGLSKSKGSEYDVSLCEGREEKVETERTDATAPDLVRKGFSTLPKWLSVRWAAPAALCIGARVGRLGLPVAVASSRSSGGVTNGSSGGCCCTSGSEVTEGYDLKDGVAAIGAIHSRDSAGSIVISGICGGVPALTFERELALERFALSRTAANADRCFLRKLPAVSDDMRGVVGRERSGFTTRSWPGGRDSRYPSPCPLA